MASALAPRERATVEKIPQVVGIVTFRYLKEDGSGYLLLESGVDYYVLESSTVPLGTSGGPFDVYDNLNGSMQLWWGELVHPPADSYNVYVNGVLNQNVDAYTATVTGLQQTTYSQSTVSASTGNSLRPQNMPPVGQVTPSGTYNFHVCAVKSGVEVARTRRITASVNPSSIMLTTPMKRPFPYPNTGSPDG
jgi:hypothetical protein